MSQGMARCAPSIPDEFSKDVPNPWLGVTLEHRVKKAKPAVTRDEVYDFAHGCIAAGEPEIAAVAVICFEWLQRPENVIAGHIKWSDYRCACRKSNSHIQMVKSAEEWRLHNAANGMNSAR